MIKLQHVRKVLGGKEILQDISFNIESGKILCILGPSGCGKTTTLRLLAGLEQPDGGDICGLNSTPISYVFQEPRLLPWKTVAENLHFVLQGKVNPQQRGTLINQYLNLVGLADYQHYYPHALSGGMQQRLSLCRAFIYPHQLLLMDEPFKSLDTSLRLALVKETAQMWAVKQNTIVCVTHDITEALLLGHKIIVYSDQPTKIKAEFTIDLPHHQRDMHNKKLAEMYSQLIELLTFTFGGVNH